MCALLGNNDGKIIDRARYCHNCDEVSMKKPRAAQIALPGASINRLGEPVFLVPTKGGWRTFPFSGYELERVQFKKFRLIPGSGYQCASSQF